jgi:hypothetical protein
MFNSPALLLAATPLPAGRPLFGNAWLALLCVLGGVALLLAAVAALGRWLAATHPEPMPHPILAAVVPTAIQPSSPKIGDDVPAEAVPVILVAVTTLFGTSARVASIHRCPTHAVVTPSVEALMQQWSIEGRRQIYSSHKVR